MSLSLISLSSGSRGNSILVFSKKTCVVIDVGITATNVQRAVSDTGLKADAVLITHTHTDHVSGLSNLSKAIAPKVYCGAGSYSGVDSRLRGGNTHCFSGDFFVGDLTISPFSVSHDVPCVGYSIYNEGKKISILTDLGCVTDSVMSAIEGSDLVFLESNHDEQLLSCNHSYPVALKNRILSGRGHLSNTAAAEVALNLAKKGTKQIVLAHLSEQNNYPELAYSATVSALKNGGAEVGKEVFVDVATFNKQLGAFRLA